MRAPRIPEAIDKSQCQTGTKVRFRCGPSYGFGSTYKVRQVRGDNVLVGGCGWFDIALLCHAVAGRG